jgi:Domain of unknown function (DUF4381)
MNNNWLSQLAPPHAPPPPGWWPLAPGWWVLALSFLLIAAVLLYRRQCRSGRLRRAALHELDELEKHSHDDLHLASNLQSLLRRYAVAVYGRENVANLSGDDWLAFIVAHGGKELSGDAGQSLLRAAYGNRMLNDRTPWLEGARSFLRRWR